MARPKYYVGQQVLFNQPGPTNAQTIGTIDGATLNKASEEWRYTIRTGLSSYISVDEPGIVSILRPTANQHYVEQTWHDVE